MDKYLRGRHIGTGSMGCARLVHTRDGKTLVCKEINVNGMSEKDRAEAVQEAEVLRQLQHPNIISMYEAFTEGASLCIIMEFADAGDLAQVVCSVFGWLLFCSVVGGLFAQSSVVCSVVGC